MLAPSCITAALITLWPVCVSAQEQAQAPSQPQPTANVDLADPANQQVLRNWQQQTGQAIPFSQGTASIDPATGKRADNAEQRFEFHGQIELGGYTNRISNPSGNAALGSMRSGDFGKLVFQGDLRTINADQDVTYAQATLTSTDDRGIQGRYATQINNLQIGRAGVGYQMAMGDVAVSFSGLSTNQGLRGATLSKDIGAFSLSGYAGVIAESWEALAGQDTRDGQPSRTRNLRHVIGAKGEYKIITPSASLASFYVTLQSYRDRAGTASAPSPLLPLLVGTVLAPLTTLEGTVASVGGKFNQGSLQLSAELASSRTQDQTNSQDSATDQAFVIDVSYKISALSLRAGHHNLGANYAALAQSNAAGVKESYAGADWQITPQILWGIDARTAVTLAATLAALKGATGLVPASQTSLDSLSNRLSYSSQNIPGLAFSLSDTRSQGRDALGNANRIDTTQLGATFANSDWNANMLIGFGHARNAANSSFESDNSNWQLFLGRNWTGLRFGGNTAPSWTLGLQGTVGQQNQKMLASLATSKSDNYGLYLQATHPWLGSISAGFQQQSISPFIAGALSLKSNSFNLDISRDFGRHWSAKAYAKANSRNKNDALLQYGERAIGLQGIYKW